MAEELWFYFRPGQGIFVPFTASGPTPEISGLCLMGMGRGCFALIKGPESKATDLNAESKYAWIYV
jgi:hypothetical protein